jgi:hypothetical protein
MRIPVGLLSSFDWAIPLVSVVNVTIRKLIIAVEKGTSHAFVRLRLDVGPMAIDYVVLCS